MSNTHEASAAKEDVNVTMIAIAGICSAVLLFATVVLLQALFYSSEEAAREAKITPSEALATMVAEHQEQLHSYRWKDQAKQIATIPIERAMELVVKDSEKHETPRN